MDTMVESTDDKNIVKETENIESPVIGNTSKTRKRHMKETPPYRRSLRLRLSNDIQHSSTVSSTALGLTDAVISRSGCSSSEEVHQASSDSSSRDKPEEDNSTKFFGFLGLGNVGIRIANHMLTAGYKLCVWNWSSDKCLKLKEIGAEICENPKEVVDKADITFCCVGDKNMVEQMMFGYEGVLQALDSSKAVVDMSVADAKTSKLISDFVLSVGAKFLEVRLLGTISDAENGSLLLSAAGDLKLFNDCLPSFKTFSKESTFIGDEVGKAAIFNIIVYSAHAQINDAAAETCAFAETLGINISDFIETLKASPDVICPYVLATCNKLNSNDFNNVERTVEHLGRNLALFNDLAASKNLLKPISASVMVNYRYSKKLGLSNYDSSVIFQSIKNH